MITDCSRRPHDHQYGLCTRNESARLRLTLASLSGQAGLDEVVVVDDGSTDATAKVISDAAADLPITHLRHEYAKGRSAAANAGARAARGEVLIFLDGDTLAGPGFVAAHAAVQEEGNIIGRGEVWHLRCTRFHPEAAQPFAEHEARLARLKAAEREAMRVTFAQITQNFAEVHRRAQPGVYPGAGPRRLFELEMDALQNHPDCPVLWAAASGSNQSVRRESFLAAGGFHPEIDINEHRELALRMVIRGARMRPVIGARSYHLIHRAGWRDPLQDTRWEDLFWTAIRSPRWLCCRCCGQVWPIPARFRRSGAFSRSPIWPAQPPRRTAFRPLRRADFAVR